ncbi:MAG TPA: acyl-CoA thioester hydrolase/BAAT C-terminal domain-containing protein [Gammaproteobacteria bacterium]|nr:acyl-CoA thioester hydrolase/BAAT C-terminal domain-containing protein [Gammaproteobacteria bacterium]
MRIDYRDANGHGTLFAPDHGGPHPAVLALGGSDGGTPRYFADLLVPEGFACLSLAYWATPATQPWFTDIPLERVERGLRWLIERPEAKTRQGRVALIGASRGAELALLAAAAFPDLVGPVVAYTPSSVVWQGIDLSLPPGETRSSWTHRGKPLPYVAIPAGVGPSQSDKGISWLPMMQAGLSSGAEVLDAAAIEVEKCTGPVLLISGGDDRVWPTAAMCETLTDRMARYGKSDRITHLHYPDAGHMLFPYSRPADTQVPDMPTDFGGSRAADEAAHADARPRVLRCLRAEP